MHIRTAAGEQMDRQLQTIFPQLAVKPDADRVGLVAGICRRRFQKLFSAIEHGFLRVRDSLGELQFGEPTANLQASISIADLSTYTEMALGGSNGAAEAYLQQRWSCDDPTSMMRILLRNRGVLNGMETGLAKIAQQLYRARHALNRNSRAGSRRNIAAHYDLGNDFFELFLDPHMMYSSALYAEGDDLAAASNRKLERICTQLELTANDHLLEIGSGWGGLACYAAKNFGCRVTTITISAEQHQAAVQRVHAEGLSELVAVKMLDYRDLEGQFDKLVSVEMIEAVGHHYLDEYFRVISTSLKPGGKALIQAIVIDDGNYQSALKEVDYIKHYIFPGSFMPCYSVVINTAGQNRLMLEDLHDMGLSYAQTLHDWRAAYYQNNRRVSEMGYDERFQRMWEYYLCYCQAGFEERVISVGQLLFRRQAD